MPPDLENLEKETGRMKINEISDLAKVAGNTETAAEATPFPRGAFAGSQRVSLFTLGCKVNQVETEALREEFIHHGYQIADSWDAADIYVINTCAVTSTAEKKSRAIIRRARRTNPHSLVVVTGCYAQLAKSELAQLPDVDLLVSNQDKEFLVECINRYLRQEEEISCDSSDCGRLDTPSSPANVGLLRSRMDARITPAHCAAAAGGEQAPRAC